MFLKNKLQDLKGKMTKLVGENNKKSIENLVVFLILLIITIIAINTIWGKKSNNGAEGTNSTYKQLATNLNNNIVGTTLETSEYNLEEKLEDILSKISGVGKVRVLITYSETSQIIPMYNESYVSSNTEETDTSGGIRKIESTDTSKEIIFEEQNGQSVAVTQKVLLPKIEGAVVTAEGANNANIKTNIVQAVSAATGLAAYKIQVFDMET